ncbi:cobalamin-binding protein [Endozoicomonas sp. Mp262]|uniref:cobalamin-binding protein n=1 Tax=Endozoicomonas sp. Mp262 TaxID=2919499 RepID=UPI0021DF9F03
MTRLIIFTNAHSELKKILLSLFLLLITTSVQARDYCTVDDGGIKLCLKQPPKRIISLAPGSTELLYAAGAGKQLLAVDQYSDYPAAAQKLPKVGGYPNISIETLIGMNPDLVVVWTGGNSPQLIKHIENTGLTVFRLNASDLNDIESGIRKLGVITGNTRHASKSADAYASHLANLKTTYQQQSPVSVFFEIWRSPLMAIGGQQIIDSTITLCGGRNIFADAATRVPVISIESLLARNPDVIIASDPRGNSKENQQAMTRYWNKWPMLSAVKKNQLYTVSSDLIARPTPRILEGAEQICQYLQTVRTTQNTAKNTP